MTESTQAPGVALLFADADLGAHLHEALVTLGARIVYEGAAAQVQPETLARSGADVVVVNLESAEDEHFERLCALLDQGSQRVVFNDAEASRHLSGWDKARWARHLAVKLLGRGDVDPPRPADARQFEASRSGVTETLHPTSISVVSVEQRQTMSAPAPATDWELMDVDIAPSVPVERGAASQFGIEKMPAADYLKPEGDDHASPIEPGLKLELVSLEESVAPGMVDKTVSEMVLDDSTAGIRRVVLVGAGSDAVLELGEFLAGLPETLPALVLIVQQGQEQHAEVLATALGTTTRLPVKTASDGAMTRQCEAWLVPAGQRCRVERNGRLSLMPCENGSGSDSSIDRCLDALASAFGADITAVVLAGDGNDALDGAQSVIRHGGRVWIQNPESSGNGASMPARLDEEGLATFSGSPADLARHLVEECA